MPKTKVSETFIVEQALKVFSEKSYYNATMADIAAACGMLKGSLYHYFDSKEELMKAVLNYMHEQFSREIFANAYNEDLTTEEKLRRMGEMTYAILVDEEEGQIMGNIGVETARVIPEFSELIQRFFDEWIAALTHVFKAKYVEDRAREVAEQTVAEIEGAVMMMRIYNNPRYLVDAFKRVLRRMN